MVLTVALSLWLVAQPAEPPPAESPRKSSPAATAKPEESASDEAPMVTGKDFNAERSRLEALMRQKGLAFADVPKRLRDEAAKITAAMTAGNFELAIRELRVLIAWAEKADVNRAFVQSKFGRLSRNSRWYLHTGTLSEEQAQEIYTRLDKIAEAMGAERFVEANGLLNELFEYLKALPQPDTSQPPPED